MKIPEGTSRLMQPVAGTETVEGGRSGTRAFRQILEARLSDQGFRTNSKEPGGVPDDVRIRQVIDIIKLQMMLDEHLLGFMRGGDGERSLYQRFAQLQWSGPGLIAADSREKPEDKTAEKTKGKITAVAAAPAEATEREISSVVKLRKKTDRAQAYEPIIRDASKAYGVEPELIRAVIRAESNFRNESTSPKGAMGLMQLMPATARDLGVRDAYDPRENIMGGTRYLKGLLDRYRGDVPTALAAYNWGMGNVERNPEKLPRETRVYIDRIQRFMDEGKA